MKRLLHLAVGVFLFVLGGCQKTENQVVNSGNSPETEARPELNNQGLPKARTDTVVKLNGTRTLSRLDPESADLDKPKEPATGKEFLVVNVTVTYKGDKTLQIAGGPFRIFTSNKQIFDSGAEIPLNKPKGVNLISANLLPNGSETGDVVFEVPIGVKVEKIEIVEIPPLG